MCTTVGLAACEAVNRVCGCVDHDGVDMNVLFWRAGKSHRCGGRGEVIRGQCAGS